ncbi:hypothetical protein [Arcobacter sp. FWKO B]|uniref:hypothetical protein n=1 Tax=Arcobacter sp. FWKO B TaxID=2593672 RepID=UPI0018A44FB7|nr:hypothetical protein [Arcobacter sp. FWKO B]QOG13028.1 hypothetical protein FWKOB_10160 [Arcobacter sp. FWKO B]
MKFDEFKELLDNNSLSLKDFSDLTSLSYSAVTKWKYLDEMPVWVRSWFEMYEKTKKIDDFKEKLFLFAEEIKKGS